MTTQWLFRDRIWFRFAQFMQMREPFGRWMGHVRPSLWRRLQIKSSYHFESIKTDVILGGCIRTFCCNWAGTSWHLELEIEKRRGANDGNSFGHTIPLDYFIAFAFGLRFHGWCEHSRYGRGRPPELLFESETIKMPKLVQNVLCVHESGKSNVCRIVLNYNPFVASYLCTTPFK